MVLPKALRVSAVGLAVFVVVASAGCGSSEIRDRPEDCTEHEYLDESSNRCTPCPPIRNPDCRDGCGYRVEDDDRGCPVARCVSTCDLCEAGEYFSEVQTTCVACDSRPDCSQFDCTGELSIDGAYRGQCPPADNYQCGSCTDPAAGCRADDQGMCVDVAPDAGS